MLSFQVAGMWTDHEKQFYDGSGDNTHDSKMIRK